MFVHRVAKALRKRNVKFAIVGGYAVNLHGAVRGTVDLDIVLRLVREDFIAAEKSLRELGLKPRLPVTAEQVFQFREEYIKHKNLLAWSFWNPTNPTEVVDVIITHDLRKSHVDQIRSEGVTLPVLAVKDLIEMKRKSGRRQDLIDIRALEEQNP